MGLSKSSWHSQAKPRQDSELRQQIHDLARRYPRRGYRFIHALLVRAGVTINKKRVRRLWREEGLAIKPKVSRKIRTGATIPMQPEDANHVWTYDFVFDQNLEGSTLKILTLTDEFTRQSLALQVAPSFTSLEVKDVLQDVIDGRGAPTFLRSDNGSEFIARDLGIWLAVQDIGTRFIEPGKPWLQRLCRELPRPSAGRMPQSRGVLFRQTRPGAPRRLAGVLQRPQTPLVTRLPDPRRVC
ncbi:IS3 family transposase (plasmid) [Deinococcus sp. D7000]|nr:IS3 family transposase [Deinococcus sp. D7000]